MLRDAVRVLADEQVAPRAAEIDRTAEFPRTSAQLLADHDILALPFPERARRPRRRPPERVPRHRAAQPRVRHDRADPRGPGARRRCPITLAGTPEQQARWFPKLASGEHLIAFALTEAEAGSDAAAARTRAVRDGDDYVIDGGEAVHQPRLRRRPHRGLRRHRSRGAAPPPPVARSSSRSRPTGFAVTRLEHKMGIRGSPTAELAFDGVRVPAANRIGEEGDGFEHRDAHASTAAARASPPRPSGIAQGALEVATAYASERKQFGQRIGDFQMVGAMLADMDAATEAARQLLYKACVEIEAGRARRRVAGRPCVNSWPVTPPCGSRPTPSRSWAVTAISMSSRSSG